MEFLDLNDTLSPPSGDKPLVPATPDAEPLTPKASEHPSLPAINAAQDVKSKGVREPAFHLIVPLRPTHAPALASIAAAFPSAEDLGPRAEGEPWRVAVKKVTELERQKGVGRADEGGYRLYEIGWC
jgi:hypothetical protein